MQKFPEVDEPEESWNCVIVRVSSQHCKDTVPTSSRMVASSTEEEDFFRSIRIIANGNGMISFPRRVVSILDGEERPNLCRGGGGITNNALYIYMKKFV